LARDVSGAEVGLLGEVIRYEGEASLKRKSSYASMFVI
jgi:hypothetical protein